MKVKIYQVGFLTMLCYPISGLKWSVQQGWVLGVVGHSTTPASTPIPPTAITVHWHYLPKHDIAQALSFEPDIIDYQKSRGPPGPDF